MDNNKERHVKEKPAIRLNKTSKTVGLMAVFGFRCIKIDSIGWFAIYDQNKNLIKARLHRSQFLEFLNKHQCEVKLQLGSIPD